MLPNALDATWRREVTSGDGGNHSKLKEPSSGTSRLPIQFQ